MSLTESYRALVLITEEEMWEKRKADPTAKGVPEFYHVAGSGRVWFFPMIDPTKCTLMCKEGMA